MSEFICPRTGEECTFHGFCERHTQYAREMVEEWSTSAHDAAKESIEQGPPEYIKTYVVRDGEFVALTREEEIARRKAIIGSPEMAATNAELHAHMAIEGSLPVAVDEDVDNPDAIFDTYSALEGTVCLAGTAEHVREIMTLSPDEIEQKIGNLILWINALTPNWDITDL